METIFLMILFFAPGLAINTVYNYLNKKEAGANANAYDYIFEIAMHGTIVFILTQIACILIGKIPGIPSVTISSLDQMFIHMNSFLFILVYSIITIVVTFIWYKLFYKCVFPYLEKKKSNYAVEKYGIGTESRRTVYEKVFRDPKNKGRLVPVELVRDGQRVSCGILNYRNSPNYNKMEFTLDYTQEIAEILKEDESRKDKVIDGVRFEYYIAEYDLLIRFFTRNNLERYWGEKYKNPNS